MQSNQIFKTHRLNTSNRAKMHGPLDIVYGNPKLADHMCVVLSSLINFIFITKSIIYMKIICATKFDMHGNHLNGKSQINLPKMPDAHTQRHRHRHTPNQARAIEQNIITGIYLKHLGSAHQEFYVDFDVNGIYINLVAILYLCILTELHAVQMQPADTQHTPAHTHTQRHTGTAIEDICHATDERSGGRSRDERC